MLGWVLGVASVVTLGASVATFYGLRWRRRAQARTAAYLQRRADKQTRRNARRQIRAQQIRDATSARSRGDRRPIVLVADDSTTVLETIRAALEQHQYRVVLANHGREAWAAMQDFKPDIVVSDIDMPIMDGFGLLRMIRSDIALANVPVILMTANAPAFLEAGKLTGLSGLLAKPFADRDLIDQIRFLLQEN